jgi:CRP/FNR family transcriptional regulator, cyclic AMP receptor protein
VVQSVNVRARIAELGGELGRCMPFDRLTPEGRALLLEESPLACFDPGEEVYVAGDRSTHLTLLLEGAIQIEYPTPGQSRGRVVAMVASPFMLGEAQVLHDHPWSGTGVALTAVTATLVSRFVLEQLILEEPQFALGYAKELAFRFLQSIESRKQEVTTTPAETLAKYLLSYAEIAGISQGEEIPIRQVDLGRAAGLRRETVNRVLKQWADREWIDAGRTGVRILATSKLKKELPDPGSLVVKLP